MRTHRRQWLFGASILLAIAGACSDPEPTPAATAAADSVAVQTSVTVPVPPMPSADATATAEPTSTAATTGSASAEPVASGSTAPTTTTAPTASTTAPKPAPTPSVTVVTPEPKPTVEPPLPEPTAGTADAVAAGIDAIFKDSTLFKARFIQKHKQKVSGKEREQKGTVYVQRPNKISFRYDEPNKNRIVSEGTTLKVYVAEDQQMFEHPVKDTEYPGAFGFIMGSGIRRSFDFSFNEKAKFELGYILVGKPKTPNPQYEQVLFYIDKTKLEAKNPGAVTGVLILDAQGNRNRFELFDQSFPTAIDASEFTFTPPAGTNITK